MRAIAWALGVSLLLFASAAMAENWRASSEAQGAIAYIDTESIQRSGDEVQFWRELRWPEVRELENGLRYDRMAALYLGDCRAMTLRAVKLRVNLGEKVLYAGDQEGAVEKAKPGTTAEIDLRSACFDQWPVRK
jgi:protein tyrosine/serine phosphatase